MVGEGERFETHTSEIARVSSILFYGEMEKIFADLNERKIVAISDPRAISKYFIDLIIGFSAPQAAMGYWDLVPDCDEIKGKVRLFCAALNAMAKAGQSQTKQPAKLPGGRVSVG